MDTNIHKNLSDPIEMNLSKNNWEISDVPSIISFTFVNGRGNSKEDQVSVNERVLPLIAPHIDLDKYIVDARDKMVYVMDKMKLVRNDIEKREQFLDSLTSINVCNLFKNCEEYTSYMKPFVLEFWNYIERKLGNHYGSFHSYCR